MHRLSEELIEYKNEFCYTTIAETIISIGQNYDYAIRLDKPREIYRLWREADDLEVLDKAVVWAIERQHEPTDNDNGSKMPETVSRSPFKRMIGA